LAVFVIPFLVHFRFPSSFLVCPFVVPIWVLVFKVLSIIWCFYIFYQHFASSSLFSHTSFVILCFRLSSFVYLQCHRMCSSVSFALQNGHSGSLNLVTATWSRIFSFSVSFCVSLSLHSLPLLAFFVSCPPFFLVPSA
jgi:hypothetical protein